MLSLWPIWLPDGPKYVVLAPWSAAPTSNAQRVRVEVFSKIKATFLPRNCCVSLPFFLAALSSAANATKEAISLVLKSANFKKCLPYNECMMFSYADANCCKMRW